MRARTRPRMVAAVFVSLTLLLSLSLVFTPVRSTEMPSLLYATAVMGTKLAAFNLEAQTVRVIGPIGYPLSFALAFCPPGGRPYTVTNTFTSSPQLATLNLGTGAATLVGSPLPLGQDFMGIVCSRDGTLYGVGQSDYTNLLYYNSLYVINRVTGQASWIGSTGVNDGTGDDMFMALSFAPDGKLYGATPLALYTIDLKSGLATKVADFSSNVATNVMGMTIDADGNFYLADFLSQSSIYALDPRTGVAAPILKTGLAYVHAIAFKAPG